MAKDMGSVTKDLLGAAKAKGFDTNQINSIMESPEGLALMKQLNGPGGDALKDAVSKAAGGDTSAMAMLMSTLMSSEEGRSVAKQVMGMKRNGHG